MDLSFRYGLTYNECYALKNLAEKKEKENNGEILYKLALQKILKKKLQEWDKAEGNNGVEGNRKKDEIKEDEEKREAGDYETSNADDKEMFGKKMEQYPEKANHDNLGVGTVCNDQRKPFMFQSIAANMEHDGTVGLPATTKLSGKRAHFDSLIQAAKRPAIAVNKGHAGIGDKGHAGIGGSSKTPKRSAVHAHGQNSKASHKKKTVNTRTQSQNNAQRTLPECWANFGKNKDSTASVHFHGTSSGQGMPMTPDESTHARRRDKQYSGKTPKAD